MNKKYEWEDPAEWEVPKYDAHGKPITFILHGVDPAAGKHAKVLNLSDIRQTAFYYFTCPTCGERYEISNIPHRCFNGKGDIVDAVALDVDVPELPASVQPEEKIMDDGETYKGVNLEGFGRTLRSTFIQDQYDRKIFTVEQALELLNGPLDPDDPESVRDDRERLIVGRDELPKVADDILERMKQALYGDLLDLEAAHLLARPVPGGKVTHKDLHEACKYRIRQIEDEIDRRKKG